MQLRELPFDKKQEKALASCGRSSSASAPFPVLNLVKFSDNLEPFGCANRSSDHRNTVIQED